MLELMSSRDADEGAGLFDPIRFVSEGMTTDAHIRKVLKIVRTHLDMDVGFVSEFIDGKRVFRQVDGEKSPVGEGDSDPLEESYCQRVVDGRLPELMQDACTNTEVLTIAATREMPVAPPTCRPISASRRRPRSTSGSLGSITIRCSVRSGLATS